MAGSGLSMPRLRGSSKRYSAYFNAVCAEKPKFLAIPMTAMATVIGCFLSFCAGGHCG